MTSFRRYGSFFLLAMALGIAPGPDILFVFAQSLAQGQAAGSLVTLGLCTGLVFHVSLAAFGIAAVLRRKPHLFKAITWCGAAYLVWLGIGAWRSAVVPVGESTAETMPYLRLYLRGIVMNVCNPKVMLFFLALMPRFVVPERGRVTAQFLLLGLTFAAATLLVFNLVAVGGGALSAFLSRWPESPAFLQCFSAIVMFGLAGWIGWMNLRKEGSPSPEAEKGSKCTPF